MILLAIKPAMAPKIRPMMIPITKILLVNNSEKIIAYVTEAIQKSNTTIALIGLMSIIEI